MPSTEHRAAPAAIAAGGHRRVSAPAVAQLDQLAADQLADALSVPTADEDQTPDLSAALATLDQLAALPADHSRAARDARAAAAPTVYASDRARTVRQWYGDTRALATGRPGQDAELLADAAAAQELEDLRLRVRRAGRDRERLARFAALATRRRDHFAARFDPDPRRFGAVADAFAALTAQLTALVSFLRTQASPLAHLPAAAPAELATGPAPTNGPPGTPTPTAPPSWPADLLTVSLTVAPAAPPRAAVAAPA